MNEKMATIIKNLSYTFTSNLISFIVSTLVILIIPKMIGVREYGYWQLYIFYYSYVGFMHFGWIDGIYLRYGGDNYNELDKKLLYSQFVQLLIVQSIFAFVICIISFFMIKDGNKEFILYIISFSMIISNLRTFFLFIMQATNRIREYANVTMVDRVVYIFIIVLLLISGFKNFKIMILADVFGKFLTLLLSMKYCKDISFRKITDFYMTIKETMTNINVGIRLMFANIASTLLIGVIRFGIEKTWNVATFGKVSLTLSISSMMMMFINAVGIVMFPLLRRTNKAKLGDIYSIMRDILMTFLLLSLIIYYPLKTIMVAWLPNYSESLLYMALVFPMFIYEGKMALLISTYLKTLRYENAMLKINLVSLCLSIIMTFVSTSIFKSLEVTVLNITIVLLIRSVYAEKFLASKLNIEMNKDMILEIILTIVFVLSGWYIDSWNATIIYFFTYIFYLIIKNNEIIKSLSAIKLIIKNDHSNLR